MLQKYFNYKAACILWSYFDISIYIYTYILTFTSCTETHSHYICMTLYTRNVKNSASVCDREMRGKKSKIKDRKSLIDRMEYSI